MEINIEKVPLQAPVELENWFGVASKGVSWMTGSLDPKTMTCWVNPEL